MKNYWLETNICVYIFRYESNRKEFIKNGLSKIEYLIKEFETKKISDTNSFCIKYKIVNRPNPKGEK